MNKNELVEAVAARVGDRRTAASTVQAVLDVVAATVAQGEKVALSGFGVFEKVDRAARTARNPATGGTVDVAATSVPRFRPGQGFKTAVASGSAAGGGATATATPRRRGTAAGQDDGEGARPAPRTSRARTGDETGGTSDEGSPGKSKGDGSGKAGKASKTAKAGKAAKAGSGKTGSGKTGSGKTGSGKTGSGKTGSGKAAKADEKPAKKGAKKSGKK